MEIVILDDASAVGRFAADVIVALVERRPGAVLGLATGSSPLPVYRALVADHEAGRFAIDETTMVLLDEYVGLAEGHPESYRSFVRREVLDALGAAPEQLHGPDVHGDLETVGRRYEELLASLGGVDLQVLGIGSDGHIGFNEPSSSLSSRTRLKTLTSQTRADNARFFDSPDEVPRHVVTQGLGTILDSRRAVLVATGASKAEPIARMVEGPVSAFCPASVLQFHPHVTVIVDEDAAADLRLASYYREAFASKPEWQSP